MTIAMPRPSSRVLYDNNKRSGLAKSVPKYVLILWLTSFPNTRKLSNVEQLPIAYFVKSSSECQIFL